MDFYSVVLLVFFVLQSKTILLSHCWNYQTECTKVFTSQLLFDSQQQQHELNKRNYDFHKIPATSILNIQQQRQQQSLNLKCPLEDSYIFIGLTQYGVSMSNKNECRVNDGDCLVTVDYLANECNGMNSCSLQLDSQYLHSCKNYSNYLTIAYKCLQKRNQIDVCSDSMLEKIDEFYLKSPNYPNEYDNNLNNCSCRIESASGADSRFDLKFELLEFDVEEGESNVNELCNKDRLIISESQTNHTKKRLCGQYKEFKEFNLITAAANNNNNNLIINFTTDDSISRRGFLINIKTINESKCPYNSKFYNNKKCIKIISKKLLNYKNANNYCRLLNGNLFEVNKFDDNLKLNSYFNANNNGFWLKLNNTEISSLMNIKPAIDADVDACLVKRQNNLFYENCNKNLQFICEFEIKETFDNKLKVSCGRSQSLKSTPTTTSTTTTTTTVTTRPVSVKSIIKLQPEELLIHQSPLILQQIETKTTTRTSTILINTKTFLKNTDFVIIIGAVSGILIVIIIINAFFIWNFYNRKLKGFIKTKTKTTESLYPSSTTPITTSSISNESTLNKTNDFMYLQNASQTQSYFKDFYNKSNHDEILFTNLNQLQIPHVYETIPSVHYCQTMPSSTSSNSSYLIDSCSNQYLLINQSSSINGAIIVLNGQNYYLTATPATATISPTQLSTCSSTSSTRPLTLKPEEII